MREYRLENLLDQQERVGERETERGNEPFCPGTGGLVAGFDRCAVGVDVFPKEMS